jgi:hypothetical protein
MGISWLEIRVGGGSVRSLLRGVVLYVVRSSRAANYERSEASSALGMRGRSLTQRSQDAKKTGIGEMLFAN